MQPAHEINGTPNMADSKFDVAAARKLVEEISSNLAALPEEGARHQELRDEVASLRSMLANADAQPPQIEQQIRTVHGSMDRAATELRADGIRVGIFLSEIGRMLGLD
jgi:endonuclease/exonuclease/phosphatase family metal-dependent hydrolase